MIRSCPGPLYGTLQTPGSCPLTQSVVPKWEDLGSTLGRKVEMGRQTLGREALVPASPSLAMSPLPSHKSLALEGQACHSIASPTGCNDRAEGNFLSAAWEGGAAWVRVRAQTRQLWPPRWILGPVPRLWTPSSQGWPEAGLGVSTSHMGPATGTQRCWRLGHRIGGRKDPPLPCQEGSETHLRQPNTSRPRAGNVCFSGAEMDQALAVCRHFFPSLERDRAPVLGPVSPSRQENEVFGGIHQGPSSWHLPVPAPTLSRGAEPRAKQTGRGGLGWGTGHFGISKADTSGFTLKYWLNRITAYLRKSKLMVEYWFWMSAQRAQKKWEARANLLTCT